jgi:hypothetical protein
MNSLSWLLIAIDVADSLKAVAVIFAVFGSLIAGMCLFFGYAEEEQGPLNFGKFLVKLVCFSLLIGIVVPSKQTLYYVAASEIGERISNTDQAQRIGGDVAEVLQGLLAKAKKELSK